MTAPELALRRFGLRLEARAARLVGRPAFWAVLIAALAGWPLAWSLRTPLPPPLPVLGVVPPFRLVSERGQPFGSEELRGHVWIAGFVFTRCTTVCPAVTRTMTRIQDRTRQLAPDLELVTFTVDPQWDTPARLAAYAHAHHAVPGRWTFLGGAPEAVRAAVVQGLKTAMGREAGPDGQPGELVHGTHLLLVDAAGRLRGTYDTASEEAVDTLVRDAALLVNRGR